MLPWKHRCVYFHPYCLGYNEEGVCNFVVGDSPISELATGYRLGGGLSSSQKADYKTFIEFGAVVQNRSESASSQASLISATGPGSPTVLARYDPGAIISVLSYANV